MQNWFVLFPNLIFSIETHTQSKLYQGLGNIIGTYVHRKLAKVNHSVLSTGEVVVLYKSVSEVNKLQGTNKRNRINLIMDVELRQKQ